MQTLARCGSTKTGSFHGLHPHPVHEEGPPHYEEKAETNIHHYCKSDDFRAGFKVAERGVFFHPLTLKIGGVRFNQV